MSIRAIIFDFGGVLVEDDHHERNKKLFKGTKYRDKKNPKWLQTLGHEFAKGKITEREFFKYLSKKLGKDQKLLESIYMKWIIKGKERKEEFDLIRKLKKCGYKIALLSNAYPIHRKHHTMLGHYDHFHVRILSYEVGERKPSKVIYRLILKRLKMKPTEVVFIDDKERNLKPAKKLGMKTILYKDFPHLVKELRKLKVNF